MQFAAELPSPPASIFTEFTGSAGLQAGSSLPVAVQPLPLGELGSVLGPSHSSGLSSQGWQQHGRSFPPGRSRLGPPEGAQGPGGRLVPLSWSDWQGVNWQEAVEGDMGGYEGSAVHIGLCGGLWIPEVRRAGVIAGMQLACDADSWYRLCGSWLHFTA